MSEHEYVYQPLPVTPKGNECEICGRKELGQIWIHAQVEIRFPLFTLRTDSPLLCSRCNEELREHMRRVIRDLPPPFHGRKAAKAEPKVNVGEMAESLVKRITEVIE